MGNLPSQVLAVEAGHSPAFGVWLAGDYASQLLTCFAAVQTLDCRGPYQGENQIMILNRRWLGAKRLSGLLGVWTRFTDEGTASGLPAQSLITPGATSDEPR